MDFIYWLHWACSIYEYTTISLCILRSLCVYYDLCVYTTISMCVYNDIYVYTTISMCLIDSTNEWTNEDRKSEKLIHKVDKVKWSDYDEYDDRSFGAMTLAQIRTACCTFLLEIVYKPDNAWGFVEERQKIKKSLRSQNLEFWILSPAFKVLDFQCDHMLE